MISFTGLRALVAVVETGGIRQAAERLLRTPSAVSMTLKQLEKEIGGDLFVSERKNALSPLGYRVLDEAQMLLAHYDRSSAALRAFVVNEAGRCDVASVPSVAATFLPEAIGFMRRFAVSLTISVRDMDSVAVIDAVDKGAVELGFCSLDQPRKGIRFEPLFRERLDLVCRLDHPLAHGRGAIEWRNIAPEDFITNGTVNLLQATQTKHLLAESSLEARNVASILAMVRAGLGVSVLPHLCRPTHDPDIVFLPIAEDTAQREVGWICAADQQLQPATDKLLTAVKSSIVQNVANYDYTLVL